MLHFFRRGTVRVGRKAPDFSLHNQDGKTICLQDCQGTIVVLFFYPKDDTPGCTEESCSFRDRYAQFQELGATVFGISSDSVESHRSFADKLNLPFSLLSDRNAQVRRQWRVPKTLGIRPGRVTYVIDRQGVVRLRYASPWKPELHVVRALDEVRRLVR